MKMGIVFAPVLLSVALAPIASKADDEQAAAKPVCTMR